MAGRIGRPGTQLNRRFGSDRPAIRMRSLRERVFIAIRGQIDGARTQSGILIDERTASGRDLSSRKTLAYAAAMFRSTIDAQGAAFHAHDLKAELALAKRRNRPRDSFGRYDNLVEECGIFPR